MKWSMSPLLRSVKLEYFIEIQEMGYLGLAPGSPIVVPPVFALVLF